MDYTSVWPNLFDVLVSLVFYIGTSYLMNVHFGSKDFHLSCFGFSFKKNNQTNFVACIALPSFAF